MSDNQVLRPLTEHLLELRGRLIRIVIVLFVVFLALLPFARDIYSLAAKPLINSLPGHGHMIATDVVAPFFVPIKVTLMAAFLLCLPHTFYQLWAFVAPGLYRHEKRLIMPLILSASVLFFTGMAFVYFLVFPMIFKFIATIAPEGVNVATDIEKYWSFALGMFFTFGLAFETPVVVVLLNRLGVVSKSALKRALPYVVVGAFVLAAIITPPDVLSQILLALPLIGLYQAGIFFCKND